MIDDLFTETIDFLAKSHTRDAAAGQVPAFSFIYSNIAARHEEGILQFNDPSEIGGAPTLEQGHRFFMRTPGTIPASYVVVDERGRLIRIANVALRRAIGTMPEFTVVTSRETDGETWAPLLMDPQGNPVRDTSGELLLEP